MTKKDLLVMINGKTMWNCVDYEEQVKARDEFMQSIVDQIQDLPDRDYKYWYPCIDENDSLVVHYGNRFCRFKREVKGTTIVRSRDVIVENCHIQIKDIKTILDNGFITAAGNKYVIVD